MPLFEDINKMETTVFNAAQWIECGRVYKDILHYVCDVLMSLSKIPDMEYKTNYQLFEALWSGHDKQWSCLHRGSKRRMMGKNNTAGLLVLSHISKYILQMAVEQKLDF